jgi:hypothetical protein
MADPQTTLDRAGPLRVRLFNQKQKQNQNQTSCQAY